MCGLYGYCGKDDANPMAIRLLAIANKNRGTHSIGIYGNKKLQKSVEDIEVALGSRGMDIEKSMGPIVLGHNRFATMGEHNTENAHPFRIDENMVGAHNGFCLNNKAIEEKYDVHESIDSKNILKILNKEGYKAMQYIEGPLALSWTDDKYLYLFRRQSKHLHIGKLNKSYYYSSEKAPLIQIGIKDKDIKMLEPDFVYKMKDGRIVSRTRVKPPILNWQDGDKEPKLGTWRTLLLPDCKQQVHDATGGEYKNVATASNIERRRALEERMERRYNSQNNLSDTGGRAPIMGFRQGHLFNESQIKKAEDKKRFEDRPAIGLESVIFDPNGDFSMIDNIRKIRVIPKNEIIQIADLALENKSVKGTNITVRVLKEAEPTDERHLETYEMENIIVSMAGLQGQWVTNKDGLVTFNVPNTLNDTSRRLYLWGPNNLDDLPFYTKHIDIPNSTVVEVTVIIPFRFDTDGYEDTPWEEGDAENSSEAQAEAYDIDQSGTTSSSSEYPNSFGESKYYEEWHDYERRFDLQGATDGFEDGSDDTERSRQNDHGVECEGECEADPYGGPTDDELDGIDMSELETIVGRIRTMDELDSDGIEEEARMSMDDVAMMSIRKDDLESCVEDVERLLEDFDTSSWMNTSTQYSVSKLIEIAKEKIEDLDDRVVRFKNSM